jgi:hypothetical protein
MAYDEIWVVKNSQEYVPFNQFENIIDKAGVVSEGVCLSASMNYIRRALSTNWTRKQIIESIKLEYQTVLNRQQEAEKERPEFKELDKTTESALELAGNRKELLRKTLTTGSGGEFFAILEQLDHNQENINILDKKMLSLEQAITDTYHGVLINKSVTQLAKEYMLSIHNAFEMRLDDSEQAYVELAQRLDFNQAWILEFIDTSTKKGHAFAFHRKVKGIFSDSATLFDPNYGVVKFNIKVVGKMLHQLTRLSPGYGGFNHCRAMRMIYG